MDGDRVRAPEETAFLPGFADWDDPVEFTESDPPPFPTGALPWWMENFTKGMSTAIQIPVDAMAVLALVVLGTAISKKYQIVVRNGWSEQPNLYGVVALPPGSRKSAAFREATYPISIYEKIATEKAKPVIVRAKLKKSAAMKLAEEAEKIVVAKQGDQAALEKYLKLAEAAEKMEVPASPRYLVDDATSEKLISMLFQQKGRIALMSPEGSCFERIAGKSSSGSEAIDVYLKAHAGDDIRLDRVSRGEEFIEKPALSLGLAVQPDVIRSLGAKQGFRGRGLLARFLYSLPKSNIGGRDTEAQSCDPEVKRVYDDCIVEALALEVDEAPASLKFSQEARVRFAEFEKWVEPRLARGGELHDLADWGSKLPGAAVRLAGIVHAGECLADGKRPESVEISRESVNKALKIAWYFVGHAKLAFNEMVHGETQTYAKAILSWLTENKYNRVSKRDILRAIKVSKADMVDEPIKELIARGYIREKSENKKNFYEVNPKIVAPVESKPSEDEAI